MIGIDRDWNDREQGQIDGLGKRASIFIVAGYTAFVFAIGFMFGGIF